MLGKAARRKEPTTTTAWVLGGQHDEVTEAKGMERWRTENLKIWKNGASPAVLLVFCCRAPDIKRDVLIVRSPIPTHLLFLIVISLFIHSLHSLYCESFFCLDDAPLSPQRPHTCQGREECTHVRIYFIVKWYGLLLIVTSSVEIVDKPSIANPLQSKLGHCAIT